MVTIDQLDNAVIVPTPFGSITLTHRAWGFTIQAWNAPPMRSYSVLGVLENGAFVVYPGTEEYASFSLDDFLALSTDPTTGPHVIATVDAVKAAHQRIVGTDAPLPLTTQRTSAVGTGGTAQTFSTAQTFKGAAAPVSRPKKKRGRR